MKDLKKKIEELEKAMQSPSFWNDKDKAQNSIKELNLLKEKIFSVNKYDKGPAIITIFSGVGGDDAEDFSYILFSMYSKYAEKEGWGIKTIHEHKNDHGGYRNITFEVTGSSAYGKLKNESGVHRLVRISPFSAKKLRHTSFSMVEVIPKFDKVTDMTVPDEDIKVEFSRSGGPGGQNVNKRETAVRVVHIPSGLSASSEQERSQAQNKEKSIEILKGKIYKMEGDKRKGEENSFYISKTTDIKWGNQIRSYVLHPYKMVKDHRTDVEIKDVGSVFSGDIDKFIEAEKKL